MKQVVRLLVGAQSMFMGSNVLNVEVSPNYPRMIFRAWSKV